MVCELASLDSPPSPSTGPWIPFFKKILVSSGYQTPVASRYPEDLASFSEGWRSETQIFTTDRESALPSGRCFVLILADGLTGTEEGMGLKQQ